MALTHLPHFRHSAEDVEGNDVDIGVPSMPFLSEDPIGQTEIFRNIHFNNERDEQRFNMQPVREIRLSKLKDIYERGDIHRQLKLLTERHSVIVDDDKLIPGTSTDVAWCTNVGALDFLLCVPREAGLEAILPNTNVDMSTFWTIPTSDRSRHRKFKAKHARLGFSAERSMLHLGHAKEQEVWLAYAPNAFFDDTANFEYKSAGYDSGDTRMSAQLYCRTILFLAYTMNKYQISDVTLKPSDEWPENISTLEKVHDLTNFM